MVLVSLRVFVLEKSASGAVAALAGYWAETIWQEILCCFKIGTSWGENNSKPLLQTGSWYLLETLFEICDGHPRPFCMGIPPPPNLGKALIFVRTHLSYQIEILDWHQCLHVVEWAEQKLIFLKELKFSRAGLTKNVKRHKWVIKKSILLWIFIRSLKTSVTDGSTGKSYPQFWIPIF